MQFELELSFFFAFTLNLVLKWDDPLNLLINLEHQILIIVFKPLVHFQEGLVFPLRFLKFTLPNFLAFLKFRHSEISLLGKLLYFFLKPFDFLFEFFILLQIGLSLRDSHSIFDQVSGEVGV